MMAGTWDDTMLFFWDELRKKGTREDFIETYGDLLPVFCEDHRDFVQLCGRQDGWTDAAASLTRCRYWTFGRKLFRDMQQFICAARVRRLCGMKFDELKKLAEIPKAAFDEAAAAVAEQVIKHNIKYIIYTT